MKFALICFLAVTLGMEIEAIPIPSVPNLDGIDSRESEPEKPDAAGPMEVLGMGISKLEMVTTELEKVPPLITKVSGVLVAVDDIINDLTPEA